MSDTPFRGVHVGGGGLRFVVFGFPVRVQLSFFVVVLLLGLSDGATVGSVAIWTAVVAVSILCHELGHAFAARRLGSEPTIDLYSFGGMTHWQPRTEASRWHLISVALAGPAAGMALGAIVWLGALAAGGFGSGNVRFFVIVMLWVNLGWGLVNLLPVLPLDGGHVLAEMLPGDRAQRWRRAAIISVATGGVAAVVLLAIGYFWGAMVFGWAVATNLATVRAPVQRARLAELGEEFRDAVSRLGDQDPSAPDDLRRIVGRAPGGQQAALKVVAVESAAFAGPGTAARRLLEQLPGAVPPAMYALVVASETDGQRGVDDLIEIFARDPDRYHARWLAYGLHLADRLPEILHQLHRIPADRLDASTVEAAAAIAEWVGDTAVAARARSLAVRP